ncbi:MAG: ABC transporter ATP-binding protein [Chloroflexi bacterium]|nr:ABC transporter ATP-binding protein [Chloroflexota bacterium]
MALLEVAELRAGYGDTEIVHGSDLAIDEGEIVTIIGPNGSGKSTLMKALVGIVPATHGSIRFDGRRINDLRPDLRIPLGICYVPQTDNVFPRLTVLENLEMGGYLRKGGIRERIAEMFDLFPDLADRRSVPAGSLSGGQRQMMAVARALMLEPRLLLLDEPSAGLSPRLALTVFDMVERINSTGVAILMIEHRTKQALAISHRGYVLATGQVRMEAPGPQLAADEQVGLLYLGRA